MADTIIEFRAVSFAIDGAKILDSINLEIDHGKTLVLLGESGCGKTTTLRLINRLIDPISGEVRVAGRPTIDWDAIELRRSIGYVIQDGGLFPHLSVAENISLPLTLADKAVSSAKIESLLALVHLDPQKFASRFPHELSGGQRQRVNVARALATDPEILLLDEPFGALDALTRRSLQKEFKSLVDELGKTAVFVTHDLYEAMLLGSRIGLMDKGRIVFLGSPEEFSASDTPLARAYLETLSMENNR